MELTWVNRGLVVVQDEGRIAHVGGEALVNEDPHFLVYARYLTHWADGTPLEGEAKDRFLGDLVEAAATRGWNFQISW